MAVLTTVIFGAPVFAGVSDAQVCEKLADEVAAKAGLPDGLLQSISRMESGRSNGKGKVRAWPWTLNQAGKGMYFDTKQEALKYLRKAVKAGVKNIDVGCMQINYRWHGDQFASLEDMIDPAQNVAYGARYLAQLAKAHDSWVEAAKRYHSSESERGTWYYAKVERIWKTIAGATASSSVAMAEAVSPEAVKAALSTTAATLASGAQDAMSAYGRLTQMLPDSALPKFEVSKTAVADADGVPTEVKRKWDKVKAFREGFKNGNSG